MHTPTRQIIAAIATGALRLDEIRIAMQEIFRKVVRFRRGNWDEGSVVLDADADEAAIVQIGHDAKGTLDLLSFGSGRIFDEDVPPTIGAPISQHDAHIQAASSETCGLNSPSTKARICFQPALRFRSSARISFCWLSRRSSA